MTIDFAEDSVFGDFGSGHHARSALIGQVSSCSPNGIPTLSPACSFSAFERGTVITSPESEKHKSETVIAQSSELRNAPANPIRIRARELQKP